ncbi:MULTISPECIES: hypothetical protein [Shewanella]|uniref:Antitoxin Xre/MbcA/ParS-like toxin-binding domain-containing protein n=1 Tax=Shewanella baltica (strain OS155 / ATCC BAA-1091) TaxID=325240 RepID=A3DAL6_SHEB5|nr:MULTISPECIES: hypothetical protein [Shewanella]ABN63779.1 conserved hypothetical protein [Shewanella baltica OS155]AEH16125.1 hypothetical protein Sbal117_4482 [Shewanella baltica OS117]MCU8024364.1 hypothetical protein [Shewanella sp. SM78]MCU8081329.1 hypothetical protein [Shewanella sp. SM103]
MPEIDSNEPRAVSVGIRAVLKILEKWSCDQQQVKALLKLPENYNDLDFEHENFSLEQVERVRCILNIHASLRTLFTNPENVYGFMSMVNHNSPFNGSTPLNFILNDKAYNFQLVIKHLESQLY